MPFLLFILMIYLSYKFFTNFNISISRKERMRQERKVNNYIYEEAVRRFEKEKR